MRPHHRFLPIIALISLIWSLIGLSNASMAQNFKWGPFDMTAGAIASADYRDNANTSANHPKADVLLTLGPTLNGGVYLPFAGGEKFTLTVAASYTRSLTGVTPNTFGAPLTASLQLPMYVAEWTVLVFETFTYNTDPLQSTFAVNTSSLEEYSNIAGASATRQFGRFAATFAVQRTDNIYPTDSSQNVEDYQFSFTPSFMLAQGYSVFLRTSYGLTYVDGPGLQNSAGYSIDAGVNGQITPSLNGTISLGWTHEQLEASGTNTARNIDGVDSNVTLSYTHPLRPNTTHSIAFYRNPGVALLLMNSSITQATGVNYTISHHLNRFLTLSPQVGWAHLVSLSGPTTLETADYIQVGFALQRTFTKHLTGTFSYLHQIRDSNIPANTYVVNDVTVTAAYTF